MTKRTRVLLVEPAPLVGPPLAALFGKKLERVGGVITSAGLIAAVRDHEPDVVVVRIDGPSAELSRAVEQVMAEDPVPMLLLATGPQPRQAALALLSAGALDVAPVPTEFDAAALASLERALLLLSTVKVVKHPQGRKKRPSARLPRLDVPIVAIASSLGGPKALATLLSGLPRAFPAPICICQHITPGFSDDLARWLTTETGHHVVEAAEGLRLERGTVYVAPSDVHFTVSPSGNARLERGPPIDGFLPSCNVLLKSVATSLSTRAIGVVLTGMGRDGARGLKEIRLRGGHTIAQDEATSVVWGMPKEAIALGAAEHVLPLERIAPQLIEWVTAR